MKKNTFLVLSVVIMCSMFSSCGVVEKTYPLIDYVTVEKSSQDLYARNDAFAAGDTMCLDTTLVASFAKRKNISSKYQYIISKPKVEWQRKNFGWIASKDGRRMRWTLFYTMLGISVLGLWMPLLYAKFMEKMEERRINRLEKKANKAISKEKYVEADNLYAKLENTKTYSSHFGELKHWTNRIIPYSLLALTIVEGLYLFIFNFNMPMLSPARVGLWNAFINIVLLTVVIFSQSLGMYLYADLASTLNHSDLRWWQLPIKWFIAIAILVAIFKNTFVMPLDIIAVLLGAICMIHVLLNNKVKPMIDVAVFAVTLLLMSYIYMYMLSYTLLVILTIVFIFAALFLLFKNGVGASVEFSNDQSNIRERMQRNPTLSYDEASRQYYAEKRAEIKKKMEKADSYGFKNNA